MSDFKSKLGEKFNVEEIPQEVEPLSSSFQRFLRKGLYAIWDKKACIFCSHFICNNDIAAQRAFIDCIAAENSTIHNYYHDFQLFKLGDVDERGHLQAFDDELMLLDGLVAWETWQTDLRIKNMSAEKLGRKLKMLHDNEVRKSKAKAQTPNPNAEMPSGATS